MSKKLFRALKYVKNKPVEISVGISPEEAAKDNVGDDKAKLVFTTDRRIFLNGEEIARTKGDERPKPIVNKAIPRFPMIGSRYVVRWSKTMKTFKLNFVVSGKIASSEEEQIDLTNLDAEVVRIFGEENIRDRFIKMAIPTRGVGYISLPWQLSTTVNNTYDEEIKVLVQYLVDIPNYGRNFFVLKVNTNDILSSPNFEKEFNGKTTPFHPQIENEPCASPDYAIMNGNLFCVKMPNVKDSYVAEGMRTMPPDMIEAKNTHNVYYFRGTVQYKTGNGCPYHIDNSFLRWVWVRSSNGDNTMKRKPYRFYAIKKHGRSREQSIHFVEFKYHYSMGQMSIKK